MYDTKIIATDTIIRISPALYTSLTSIRVTKRATNSYGRVHYRGQIWPKWFDYRTIHDTPTFSFYECFEN